MGNDTTRQERIDYYDKHFTKEALIEMLVDVEEKLGLRKGE